MTARVTAVVVDWHHPLETAAAIRSLAAMVPSCDRIIVVENEPTAAELEMLRGELNQHDGVVDLVTLDINVGFAGGVNVGVERALARGAEWVLLLNNDAEVLPACLGRCLDAASSQPDAAVVGPAVAFTDRPDLLWYGGGVASHRLAYIQHRGLMRSSHQPPPSSDTDYVPGCCALISMRAWRAVGSFREDYFAYYEDVEWCRRAVDAGWRCLYVGEVLCHHAVGVSAGRRGSLGLSETTAYYQARNPLRFALDTASPWLRASRVAGLLTVWAGYNAWRMLQARRVAILRAYLQGLSDAVRGRMGPRSDPVRISRITAPR